MRSRVSTWRSRVRHMLITCQAHADNVSAMHGGHVSAHGGHGSVIEGDTILGAYDSRSYEDTLRIIE
eukprot:2665416-Rhodomonas_salina.1